MSLDTVKRVADYWKSTLEDVSGIHTVYFDKNYGLPESTDGPWVKLFIEASFDDPLAVANSQDVCFTEDGQIIAQIYAEKGIGDKDLYSLERVSDLIKEAFRGFTLLPGAGEKGNILFEDISSRQTIEIDRSDSNFGRGSTDDRDWRRKDIFINYQKNYE